MDTRLWGPPAWILLHTLAYHYKPELKSEYKIFFNNLKYVLPCIYCRVSFTEYTEALPIDSYLKSRDDIFKWLYEIHNMVNDKLRSQGLIHWENPSLSEIINRCAIETIRIYENPEGFTLAQHRIQTEN